MPCGERTSQRLRVARFCHRRVTPNYLVKLTLGHGDVSLGSQGVGARSRDQIVTKVSRCCPQMLDGKLQSVSGCLQPGRLVVPCLACCGRHLARLTGSLESGT